MADKDIEFDDIDFDMDDDEEEAEEEEAEEIEIDDSDIDLGDDDEDEEEETEEENSSDFDIDTGSSDDFDIDTDEDEDLAMDIDDYLAKLNGGLEDSSKTTANKSITTDKKEKKIRKVTTETVFLNGSDRGKQTQETFNAVWGLINKFKGAFRNEETNK